VARVFVPGSSTGLGPMAAELLVEQGQRIVLRAIRRAPSTRAKRRPRWRGPPVGDLSAIAGTACVAVEVDALGRFGAVIHNAGAFDHDAKPLVTEEGPSRGFAINALTRHVVTALIARPDRLFRLSRLRLRARMTALWRRTG